MASTPLDAKDVSLARKLYAQTKSDKADAHVALDMLKKLLATHGKSMDDMPEILGKTTVVHGDIAGPWYAGWEASERARARAQQAEAEARKTRSGRNPDGSYSFYNMDNQEDRAAHAEHSKRQRAHRLRKEASARERAHTARRRQPAQPYARRRRPTRSTRLASIRPPWSPLPGARCRLVNQR